MSVDDIEWAVGTPSMSSVLDKAKNADSQVSQVHNPRSRMCHVFAKHVKRKMLRVNPHIQEVPERASSSGSQYHEVRTVLRNIAKFQQSCLAADRDWTPDGSQPLSDSSRDKLEGYHQTLCAGFTRALS